MIRFAGTEFKNALIAASSPLTETAVRIRECERAGFGGVILKSCDPIDRHLPVFNRKVVYTQDGFCADGSYQQEILSLNSATKLFREVRDLSIPVIPSVSCLSLSPDEWLCGCMPFVNMGARLIQLDFFYLGTQTATKDFADKLTYLLQTLRVECAKQGCNIMPKLNVNLNPRRTCELLAACGIKQVSLLDSIRYGHESNRELCPLPEELGMHAETASYFGHYMFPYTVEYLNCAKEAMLEVCAGGGVTSAQDMQMLIDSGAGLVQVASHVLSNGFPAVSDLLNVPRTNAAFSSTWCDVGRG